MNEENESYLQVKLPEPLMRAMDHWRIDNRLTRKEAVAKLLLFGMMQLGVYVGLEDSGEANESDHG